MIFAKRFSVHRGGDHAFDRIRVGVLTFTLAASVTGAWGQGSLSTQDRARITDPAGLASGNSSAAPSCQVSPERPYLGFDLRFHADYRAAVPVKMLAGAGGSLEIALRVTAGSPGDPVYLVQQVGVPDFPPGANGMGWLAGGFDVGPGRYQVDWMMRDTVGRTCAAHWDVSVKLGPRERNVALTLGQNAVA